jgi:hypothetical protein
VVYGESIDAIGMKDATGSWNYTVEPSELLVFKLKGLAPGEPMGERAVLPGISSTSLPLASCCIISAEFLPRNVFHVAGLRGLLSGDLIVTGVWGLE